MTVPLAIDCAAAVLGVDPQVLEALVRRGRLPLIDRSGPGIVDGAALVDLLQEIATERPAAAAADSAMSSARNRIPGLVTRVVRDTVMAQVELQVGAFRFVSLMSREAADELELQPGVIATVSVKATNVVVERPARS